MSRTLDPLSCFIRWAVRASSALAIGPLALGQGFDWRADFAHPGLNAVEHQQVIRALLRVPGPAGTGDIVYVAGDFDGIQRCKARGIARWDGETFVPLGQGITSSGAVLALAHFGGELYAGGYFSSAGGQPVHGLARWDGASWSAVAGPFGEGVESASVVHALMVFDDGGGPALYVAGAFTIAGGLPAASVARWTGSVWEPLGAGFNAWVEGLEVWDDGTGAALYAGGYFTSSGGAPVVGVARWNGTSWQALGSGGPTRGIDLGAFDQPSTGGLFVFDGAETWRWNGTVWSSTGGGYLRAFAVFDDGAGPALYGGYGVLRRWNGSAWNSVGAFVGTNGNWPCLALTTADFGAHGGLGLVAGGGFSGVDTIPASAPLITKGLATWDGAQWRAPGPPSLGTNGDVTAFASFDDGRGEALYVAGNFTRAGSVAASYVARWDGTAWEPLGAGVSWGVDALAVFDDGAGEALYAGGSFAYAGGTPATAIARWDGSGWSALGAGVSHRVWSLASFDDGTGAVLVAGGLFTSAGGQPANHIARWDGATWAPMGAGFGHSVFALAVYDSGQGPELYAGGGFGQSGGVSIGRIARWTGSAWVEVGGGVDDTVWELLPHAGALYVGGSFFQAGGLPIDHLARWDGASWSAVTVPSPDLRVKTLAVLDQGAGPELYVGGWFEQPVAHVGRVVGNQLVALGAGVDDQVEALFVIDDGRASRPALYAGGRFARAGDFSSPFIARWANGNVPPAASYCTAGTTANGCNASITATGEASRCSSSGFDVSVSGVEGQKFGILFFGLAPAARQWGSGSSYLCIATPTTRASMQTSGGSAAACDGAFALDFNAWMRANPFGAPAPGTDTFLQAWFRDPPSPKGTSLSNALRFEVAP